MFMQTGLTQAVCFQLPVSSDVIMGKMSHDSHDMVGMTATEEKTKAAVGGQPPLMLSGDFLPADFRTQSCQITSDIIHYICKRNACEPPPDNASTIMRHLVDIALQDRLRMMMELTTRLDVQRRDQLQLINDIATNMFEDQIVSWGRIVTLHAFCGYLARYCQEKLQLNCADEIAVILSDIVINRLGLWIVVSGGWVSLSME